MGDKTDDYSYTPEEMAALSEAFDNADSENRRIRALFLEVFGTDHGKEVLKVIREEICRVGRSCFEADALQMARRCGRQEAAYAIDEILAAAEADELEKARND